MSHRILVCDDHPYITKMVALTMRKEGFEPETCHDGDAAWTALNEDPAELLISDCEMPGMNGLDLCRKIRSDHRFVNMPVILLTARAFQLSHVVLRDELNILAIIKKPFSPRELRQKVVAILNDVQTESPLEE